MRYLPHTPEEIATMLRAIGKSSVDELFEQVPKEARLGRPLAIEPALDEAEPHAAPRRALAERTAAPS